MSLSLATLRLFRKQACEANKSLFFAGRVTEASMPVVSCSPPPALPPKKRQSAPSPTRVAVVAPMSRATSGSSLPVGINRQVMAQPRCENPGECAGNWSQSSKRCCDLQLHARPCSSQPAPDGRALQGEFYDT